MVMLAGFLQGDLSPRQAKIRQTVAENYGGWFVLCVVFLSFIFAFFIKFKLLNYYNLLDT